MIISFYSTHHGQTATTTNALSVGLCTALHYKLKVLMVSVQDQNDLMAYLTTKRMITEGVNFTGTDDLMRLAKNGLLQPQSLKNYTTPILKHSLLDILPNFKIDEHDPSAINYFTSMIEMAKSSYDVILLDIHFNHDEALYKLITAYSNALVLNINQNRQLVNHAIELVKLKKDDTPRFICVGRYEKSLKMNDMQLKKMLGVKQLMTINYDPKLIDVLNIGNALEYFGRFFYNEKLDQSNPYIKSVLSSTALLLEALSLVK